MADLPIERLTAMVQSMVLAKFPEMPLASIKISFRDVKVEASHAISKKINDKVKASMCLL